ncbi:MULTISPECIES: response regulator [Sphingomonadaceae]|jgi:CheY-like chemotaxis protein/DNA-directed RNA polymerase specialized sigma24 family protein|uniref:Two-component response regulator n=2 Tax=Novosphingobium TaxID=165696 RepID=A0A031JTV1_9SPHN|nr:MULTISPECIES: response regulator [Sphingomonadaceae]AOR76944.1 two-component response regulator [Novosphingobium resinovorum]EJU09626.1 two-component response regulator [Sphingomonas sp. LH128]EZP80355.1 Two-component response regulator [Novosphingobium resinovorum]MBF7012320.1 response regulator [Novosphingobium sp. HR1a]WJM27062.1 response regulator [Novosphingobium resinovorum]
MSVSDQIAIQLPYLRRYARALTGSQHSGDAYVRATLEAALADRSLRDAIARSRAALYEAFTRIWSTGHVEEPAGDIGGGHEQAAQERLAAVAPTHRQALLLTSVEEFTREETATILGLEVEEVDALVSQAIAEIEGESATRVLIIEDEPLISMQLEGLVTDLGHTVVGTAATHKQAIEIFEKHPAGLVLADIQLADGSSGIDAVEDLLKFGEVPVIFITAYPERLLTGERPEPTYLVTKPFQETTVRATISQALFFNSTRPQA